MGIMLVLYAITTVTAIGFIFASKYSPERIVYAFFFMGMAVASFLSVILTAE